jgi:DNA-binding FadR family transcriptional regulator
MGEAEPDGANGGGIGSIRSIGSIPTVARGNLTDRVQALLRERILSGDWPAGTRLPAIERLAADAGVSRTVAREAVKALATQGLLAVAHGHGTVVAARTNRPVVEALRHGMRASADLLGIMEVRLALEAEAAALAAERRTEEDLTALRDAAERMRKLRWEREASGFVQADLAFHEAVVRATHNPMFTMVAESIAELLEETRLAVAERETSAGRETAVSDGGAERDDTREEAHAEILRRIEARDRGGAGAAMRQHLDRVRANLEGAVRQRGGGAAGPGAPGAQGAPEAPGGTRGEEGVGGTST